MATPGPRLVPGYYVANFEAVLATVVERYGDLLSPLELGFAERFLSISIAAKRLYVRLVSRRGPCFRRDGLRYREVEDLDAAIAELVARGFLDDGLDAPCAELLRLWRKDELLALADTLASGLARSARRAEVLARLESALDEAELADLLRRAVAIVRVLGLDLVRLYRLLFFGNLRQDWTEFVLRDLGVVRYESYPLGRELRRFPDRRSLDDELALRDREDEIDAQLAAGELDAAVVAAEAIRDAPWHALARRRRDHALARVGRELERAGELEKALGLYQATPVARERLVRVLAKLGRKLAALAVCEAMVETPRDEAEVAFAASFPARLLGDSPSRRRRARPTTSLAIAAPDGLDPHDRPVEQRALKALAERGESGFFAENWLWRSLFGLLFWDIVFAGVPGAFHHPFQYGPSDLHGPEFRAARADAIADRLRRVADDAAVSVTLLEVYDRKHGVANPFVAWEDGTRERIALAAERLGGRRLAAVADRIARDPGRYAYGFPDLFVCTAHSPRFVLYEVKGPGDVLRPEQGAWIDFMNGNDIPAVVLRAKWREVGDRSI